MTNLDIRFDYAKQVSQQHDASTLIMDYQDC